YPCDLMLCYTPISSLIPYSTLIRSLVVARSFDGFLIRVYFRALRHSECPHRFNQRIEDQLPPSEVLPFLAFLNLTKILTEGNKRSEEHTYELQSRLDIVCRFLIVLH